MTDRNNGPDIVELANELIYQKYIADRDKVFRALLQLTLPEYIALNIIAEADSNGGIYSGRTYLKDLADKLQLPMRQTSNIANTLKQRGLLEWSHDGDGSEGSYVSMTDTGRVILAEQKNVLRAHYEKVINHFGMENLITLLRLTKQLETVMSAEFEDMEDSYEQ